MEDKNSRKMAPEVRKKVAILTNLRTEVSWLLIKKVKSKFSEVIVISEKAPRKLGLGYILIILKDFFVTFIKGLITKQPTLIPILPYGLGKLVYVNSFNSKACEDILRKFQADVLCISGTSKIESRILNTAPLALNNHAGFVPCYRGVSSIDWTTKESNFDYYYNTIHEATDQLDAGLVFDATHAVPYIFETYHEFRRRFLLEGSILFANEIGRSNSTPLTQPSTLPPRNFRHRDKKAGFSEESGREFSAPNLRRYVLQSEQFRLTKTKALRTALSKSNKSNDLPPGLYILNYHYICSDLEAEELDKQKVPRIYTSINKMKDQINALERQFTFLGISSGLEAWRNRALPGKRILVITFDDGLSSTKEAIDFLSTKKIQPALFLAGDPLIRNRPLKNHQEILCRLLSQRYSISLDSCREAYLEALDKGWGINGGKLKLNGAYLNTDQILKLVNDGTIEVGSHTYSHRKLSLCERNEQRLEIVDCHRQVEATLGRPIKYFSFPFGKTLDRTWESEYFASEIATDYFSCNGGINSNPLVPGAILRISVHNESAEQLFKLLETQYIR